MTTKKSSVLTLRDRLSRLSYIQACKLLGPQGKELLSRGGMHEVDNLLADVHLGGDLFRVRMPAVPGNGKAPVVSITLMASAKDRLHLNCTACTMKCEHMGAALSLILEEKMALGLAAPPPERQPMESLSEEELIEHALAERQQRADEEKFRLSSDDPQKAWTDYTITSAASGKSYRLALRGEERGQSYCSCPDFRTNTLGTCKHLLYALDRIKRKFPATKRRKHRNRQIYVHLLYGDRVTLHLRLPEGADDRLQKMAGNLADAPIENVRSLVRCIGEMEKAGYQVQVYPDAEEFIGRRLLMERLSRLSAEIRSDPAGHRLRKELLHTELLPYQLDGIAFAAGAGRSILADDMGLGKTIQGIGLAELLARQVQIGRVLVICPASVKSQWRREIQRFSDRSVQIVAGRADERSDQYDSDCFFTICNYEQVLRDLLAIERVPWDLIILDEGQRIKNWESKTAGVIKSLRSTFALVLTGTPLENRLDDLYSVAQFVDDRRLGPAFRFFNQHRVVDEKGKVLGYKQLDVLRARLQPILLRRTRKDVLAQLPPRTTEIVRIPPSDEQHGMHQAHMQVVSMITRKHYITEMDLLRLQKALLMCRMAANSTYLVDKEEPGYSTKLERLGELLDELLAEEDRKLILFSEWTTMLDLIERKLVAFDVEYVRLDGSVPQRKRQELVNRFQEDGDCRLFLTTNAGSTGLNLQAANTVINVDLPWNPAVLEQRVARAHRMGQKQPVQVYVLVTEATIEENLLGTLSAKHELSLAVLDANSDVSEVDMASGMEELRRRLEILLGAKPEAPLDQSQRREAGTALKQDGSDNRREQLAAAGGELLGAAFTFLGQLVEQDAATPPPEVVHQIHTRLSACVEEDDAGRQRLSLTLPDRKSLENLAQTIARLLAAGQGP